MGRFGLNDYVARVVEREGDTAEPEAARALAVAARSYLVQQATRAQGCFRIGTAAARNACCRMPAAAARHAADQTDGLVLSGVAVRYHHDAGGKGRMARPKRSARQAVVLAFDAILARWWPQATLTSFQSPVAGDCPEIAGARQWLAGRAKQWQAAGRRIRLRDAAAARRVRGARGPALRRRAPQPALHPPAGQRG